MDDTCYLTLSDVIYIYYNKRDAAKRAEQFDILGKYSISYNERLLQKKIPKV